ncbi:hypothetical protein BYT27DRAFT_7194505 [Phlegmacium glaucopus]|nr:hypothetical protein BYT27DRAFT_7194505 [Phlegmacium glaucopus]
MLDPIPLIVAQYELKGHPTRTEHWNLVALTSSSHINTFEVRGNTDSFTYVTESTTVPLNKIPTFRGGCHIGDIPIGSISEITERLEEIPIIRHDLSWDCQVWVIQATKLLKSVGLVFGHVDERYIRERLLEDMAMWEEAEKTVDERLLASDMRSGECP